MKDTLFDLAYSHMQVAAIILDETFEGSPLLNAAAFHLEKSIELYLKYYLDVYDVVYEDTVEIGELLALVDTNGIKLPLPESTLDSLYLHGISSEGLQEKLLYRKNYRVSMHYINECLLLCGNLFSNQEHSS